MRPNLLSFGAGQLVLRTKLFQEGGDDAIMDEEVQEKQLLAEEEDGMEQLEAEEGLEAAQLEPDGAKHMELEPDGIKELAAEKELVSKDSVAAPMELITHSGVNLEPRWRRHDPKPPWFLIQAQEISKWACVSFVLFFPCQVLSQWVFLTRFLMRQMGHIQITHLADQDQGPFPFFNSKSCRPGSHFYSNFVFNVCVFPRWSWSLFH
ncbi:unnamed protein product [Microthlaspi erraticum]|uniref:Uncharacterized protein n=1 Tax=Microthlaspi erraticum TaxID=1685480 RepID=A0A6D2L5G9_9BRAS|nr:unnamed protein product [Microthlaspi erraticum]